MKRFFFWTFAICTVLQVSILALYLFDLYTPSKPVVALGLLSTAWLFAIWAYEERKSA